MLTYAKYAPLFVTAQRTKFPQSPTISPFGNFSKFSKFSKLPKFSKLSNAPNASNASNFVCALITFGVPTLKFPLCKGNKYPANAKNLCAEKSPSLQKQKKSSIFRTVICLILDYCGQSAISNYLWYKRLD